MRDSRHLVKRLLCCSLFSDCKKSQVQPVRSGSFSNIAIELAVHLPGW